jgi:hypothetical protein
VKSRTTATTSRDRSTREDSQPYAGTNPTRIAAWNADAYDFSSAPPLARMSGSRAVLRT